MGREPRYQIGLQTKLLDESVVVTVGWDHHITKIYNHDNNKLTFLSTKKHNKNIPINLNLDTEKQFFDNSRMTSDLLYTTALLNSHTCI